MAFISRIGARGQVHVTLFHELRPSENRYNQVIYSSRNQHGQHCPMTVSYGQMVVGDWLDMYAVLII